MSPELKNSELPGSQAVQTDSALKLLECRRSQITAGSNLASVINIFLEFNNNNPFQILAESIGKEAFQLLRQELHRKKIKMADSADKNLSLKLVLDAEDNSKISASEAIRFQYNLAPAEYAVLAIGCIIGKARQAGLDLSLTPGEWRTEQEDAYKKLSSAEVDILKSLVLKGVKAQSIEIYLNCANIEIRSNPRNDSNIYPLTLSDIFKVPELKDSCFAPLPNMHHQPVNFEMISDYLPTGQFHQLKQAVSKFNSPNDRKAVAGLRTTWQLHLNNQDRDNLIKAIKDSGRSVLIDELNKLEQS